MWRHLAVVLVVLTAANVGQAQDKLDNLLPAGSQLYLRWDGVEAHKEAADKLAVMKLWKGETGEFLRGLWQYITVAGKEALANEINPELAGAVFDEFGGVLQMVGNKGFALGVEVQSVDPFKMQATLVFPNGGGPVKSPLSFMSTMTRLDPELKVRTFKEGQRQVNFIQLEPIFLAWWAEGKDAVWSVGTAQPDVLIKSLDNQQAGLATKKLYKDVQGFKEFPTWMRGYLDLGSLSQLAGNAHPIANQVISMLGVDTIKSMRFVSGFDGPAERAVTFTDLTPGPRKGIMKIFSDKTFTLKDLPPMPEDLTSFSAGTVDWQGGFDLGVDVAATLVSIIAPFGAPDIKQGIKDFEQNNNVSISAVFNSLDHVNVSYAASAEGFLGMGQATLIKLKDQQKLEQELNKLLQLAERESMGFVKLRTSQYRGAAMQAIAFSDPFGDKEFSKIWFTIHKGWLVVSQYPQPIKGFILRANGELPVWKADKDLQTRLDAFPKQFTGLSVSDPRPSLKMILSILPPVLDIGQMVLQEQFPDVMPRKGFDISLIPNAYEAARDLFPNITVTTFEGDTFRSETRASLALPF